MMKKYILSTTQMIRKFIIVEADSEMEAVEKVLRLIAEKEVNFEEHTDEDKSYEIYAIYSDTSPKEFAKKEDEKYEDNNENFAKEYIEVCCEKCGNCILLDDIIHHLDS